tara:strand:- start:3572 stop:4429 length:858 start_codon:yes stop_codon:yes gene_type:complete
MSNLNLVKELREKTGAGFLDCKEALSKNSDDIDNAIDFLRKKGLAKASKKSTREANEGAIGIYENEKICVILKVNSETDFAAKSDTFLDFIDYLGNLVLGLEKLDLNLQTFLETNIESKSIKEIVDEMIAKVGENIIISDLKIINKLNTDLAHYVHNSYRKNIGKLISVLDFESIKKDKEINNFAKNLCMHIAALKPEAIDKDDLDKSIIDKELNIQKELISSSGKPSNVVDKILDGKMKKFYSEITLLNQSFVLDNDKTVKEKIENDFKDYAFKIKKFELLSLI